jgi:hypothetical protein
MTNLFAQFSCGGDFRLIADALCSWLELLWDRCRSVFWLEL